MFCLLLSFLSFHVDLHLKVSLLNLAAGFQAIAWSTHEKKHANEQCRTCGIGDNDTSITVECKKFCYGQTKRFSALHLWSESQSHASCWFPVSVIECGCGWRQFFFNSLPTKRLFVCPCCWFLLAWLQLQQMFGVMTINPNALKQDASIAFVDNCRAGENASWILFKTTKCVWESHWKMLKF